MSQATQRQAGLSAATAQPIEELSFHNASVSVCLLLNRRNKTMRVIDFRAGPTLAKRNFVIATAKREGIEKVFVLVERDEVTTWMRLGFRREGNIPSFYKRSDAWLMGAVVTEVGPMRAEGVYDDDEIDADLDEPSPAIEAAHKIGEKAKKLVKDTADKAVPATKVAPLKKDAVQKAVVQAMKASTALSAFEPFSRDAERIGVTITGKGGFELVASYELQPSFGSCFFEILTGPSDEVERMLTLSAIRSLASKLVEAGAVSAFTIVPADDVMIASCLLANGFRRSATLASHIVARGARRDAVVWSKRLVGEN